MRKIKPNIIQENIYCRYNIINNNIIKRNIFNAEDVCANNTLNIAFIYL